MSNRLATIAFFVFVVTISHARAETIPLFDIIIPDEITIRASNNTIGSSSGFGWLIARGDTLTVADLQAAEFTGVQNEPVITEIEHGFRDISGLVPILPGQATGSGFVENIYSPLLLPGESFATLPTGNGSSNLMELGFRFPTSPTYTGSSFDFEGSVTIRGETVTYSTDVTITRDSFSSSPIISNPRRLSSAPVSVPEPSSTALVLSIALGAACRRRRVA